MRKRRALLAGLILGVTALVLSGLAIVAIFGLLAGAGFDPTKQDQAEAVARALVWVSPVILIAAVGFAIAKAWIALTGSIALGIGATAVARLDEVDGDLPAWGMALMLVGAVGLIYGGDLAWRASKREVPA